MDAAQSGQSSVDASIQGMQELKNVVSRSAQIIQDVNTSSAQISSILDIVDDIAEQTSLLLLNASIIAVANEIKELALRTKSSTQEINALIRSLQAKTQDSVSRESGSGRCISQGCQK